MAMDKYTWDALDYEKSSSVQQMWARELIAKLDLKGDERYAGVVAQEVEKVLPEVVSEDDDGMKSVAYGNMVGLLVEAIKEQQKQIDALTARINTLEG